ncbi:MAG: DUF2207 domain-containing protein [Oscillospiraceae bacterium]|nr:DUF2207 domain-containing protein [Oscillospiraceae bacterium]
MRKICIFLCLIVMFSCMTVSAGAATAAKSIGTYATVSNDGTAQVTLTANIHLDRVEEDLRFALPGGASHITVNGSRARSREENGLRQVDISRFVGKAVGDFTLTFTYDLPNLITTNAAGQLELQLPLLAGFSYPVQALEFSVTLPGPITAKPAFSSGYHQANIEKDLHFTTSGATITAVSQVELKDHETLTMTLLVTEEMFPQKRIVAPEVGMAITLTTVCLVLALLYWLLFLRNLPTWPAVRATPPEGYSAGEMGSILCLQGANLNMMVFSWAQLGYLQMELQPGGKVLLHRQMDMGNERSSFEQRCFQKLFGRRDSINAGSARYGELYRDMEKIKPNLSFVMHRKSGNMLVFRGLAALAGMFAGVTLAVSLASGAGMQWFLMFLLGAVALVSCWHIQAWAVNLFVPDRRKLWIAIGLCGLWLLLGALGGQFNAGLGMVAGQLFAGLLAAIGGRRTPEGRLLMGQTLGLRRYLRSVSAEQLRHICQNSPEYFHQMAPYAMALGVDGAFAKRFGKLPMGSCPYIFTGTDSTLRATQWNNLMRRVLKGMNTRPEQSRLEKLMAILQSFIK